MERKTSAGAEKSTERVSHGKKLSDYGRQLHERQKVKDMYGLRERQFRKLFRIAIKSKEATGEELLRLLEKRLDNVIYRLKFASSRRQARQIITHGHILVNGKKVYSPSYNVKINDVVSIDSGSLQKVTFVDQVIDKRLKVGIKVPEWLELDKKERRGIALREPVRSDIQVPIEEYLIVEFYSK